MKVYQALAKAFVAEGTSSVFGLMGDVNQAWIDALVKLGVDMYEVRHEGAGCAMADGWSRQNGAPGVCTTTSGPGTTQLTTALVVASRAETPLVAFCGDQPLSSSTWRRDAGSQGMDQRLFAQAAECGFVQLASAASAYETVQRAFYLARHESRPIMLSAPEDIQHQDFEDDEEYQSSLTLLTNKLLAPTGDALQEAVRIVERSERPVILVGRGAIRSGAQQEILRLADRIGAVITTSLVAINWMRDIEEFHAGVSGLYSTRVAQELFQEADCVIGIGASLNLYTTEHGYLFPNATFIQIDQKSQVVMGDGRSADCYLQADARLGAAALDKALGDLSFHQTGYRTPEVKERLDQAWQDPKVYELEPGTVDPRDACRLLDEIASPDIGLIIGAAHQSNVAGMAFTRARPYTIINKSFGAIGHGLTTAIGAVIASGKKPAMLTEGDAGFMMYLAEFDTAVRYQIPLLVAVFNNQRLASEVEKAKLKGWDPDLACIPTPDLGAVGVALGGRGRLIRTLDDLRAAAEEFVAQPAPTLLDIRISTNVLSIQYRRKYLGDDSI